MATVRLPAPHPTCLSLSQQLHPNCRSDPQPLRSPLTPIRPTPHNVHHILLILSNYRPSLFFPLISSFFFFSSLLFSSLLFSSLLFVVAAEAVKGHWKWNQMWNILQRLLSSPIVILRRVSLRQTRWDEMGIQWRWHSGRLSLSKNTLPNAPDATTSSGSPKTKRVSSRPHILIKKFDWQSKIIEHRISVSFFRYTD